MNSLKCTSCSIGAAFLAPLPDSPRGSGMLESKAPAPVKEESSYENTGDSAMNDCMDKYKSRYGDETYGYCEDLIACNSDFVYRSSPCPPPTPS